MKLREDGWTELVTQWLTNWLIDELTGWLTDRSIDCLKCPLHTNEASTETTPPKKIRKAKHQYTGD